MYDSSTCVPLNSKSFQACTKLMMLLIRNVQGDQFGQCHPGDNLLNRHLSPPGRENFNWIQPMKAKGHPDPVATPVAATKLFTVCCAGFPRGSLPAHE
jgi:hypothetical protein